jgi:hypothetical protein
LKCSKGCTKLFKKPNNTDPIERELCLIALFKEKYEHITFQRQTPQVKQVGPATFTIYKAETHQADRICKEGPNQAPVVLRVTIRPNTLVTVPSGCIMVTSTFTFSPVATLFIRDRKDYLINGTITYKPHRQQRRKRAQAYNSTPYRHQQSFM